MTTEADVEQARVRVRNLIASQVVSLNEQEALEVLLSAAMEGLKVPRLKARARVLKARLPDGMKKCTIVFKSCPLGHGRLIAKNWIDDGCQTCALRKAQSERDALRAQVEKLIAAHDRLRHDRVDIVRGCEERDAAIEALRDMSPAQAASIATCGMARYVQHDVGPDHRITEPCSHEPQHPGKHSWE